MHPKEDIQQIEQYLNNQLSESEKIAFETRLNTEEDLKIEFDKHELAHRALDYMIAKSLKQQLEALEAEEKIEEIKEEKESKIVKMEPRNNRFQIMRWVAAAASIALLIGFFFFNYGGSKYSGSELAALNYQLPESSARRNGIPVYPEVIENGLELLKAKDFNAAISTFSQVPESDDYYLEAQYYLGHAYYGIEDFGNAVQAFEIMAESNDIRYGQAAEWYGLLSCIAQNGDCKEKLNIITANKKHKFYKKAVQLKKKLN